MMIATVTTASPAYNGNPNRNDDDAGGVCGSGHGTTVARRRAEARGRPGAGGGGPAPASSRWVGQFDRAWQTLKSLYYARGESAAAWDALRAKHRPAALAARTAREVEDVVDAMVAEQPLIKLPVEGRRQS
jgi:hypothetical protein